LFAILMTLALGALLTVCGPDSRCLSRRGEQKESRPRYDISYHRPVTRFTAFITQLVARATTTRRNSRNPRIGAIPRRIEGLETMTNRKTCRPAKPLGALTVTRVITERHPIAFADHAAPLSIGQMIDEHLSTAAQRGESIQTVQLDFEPEQWEEIATAVYCGFVDDYAA
jgi:hypothetical protein